MDSGWVLKYRIKWLYELSTLKALIKLTRKSAILEFWSSNGFSSFTLNFECRDIQIIDLGDGNQSNFAYLIYVTPAIRSDTLCEERGYEKWETQVYADSDYCMTTFQGKKCSMIIDLFQFPSVEISGKSWQRMI